MSQHYNNYVNEDCKSCHINDNSCEKTSCLELDVSVPLNITPKATIGKIEIECCDKPELNCCTNKLCDGFTITVTQKICVKIPIKYDIESNMITEKAICNCNDCI